MTGLMRSLAVLALLLFGVPPALAQSDVRPLRPSNSVVVFDIFDVELDDFVVVRARLDGDEAQVIRTASHPHISPDGTRLAFLRPFDEGGQRGSLWVTDLFGGVPRQLADDAWPYFEWSPDGTRIAYVGPDGLVIVDVETGRSSVIVDELHPEAMLSWSASGDMLAVRVEPDDPEPGPAFLMNVDGSDRRDLPPNAFSGWAPNDDRLLLSLPEGLVVTSASDLGQRQVVDPAGSRVAYRPGEPLGMWSPDGQWIAYAVATDDPNGWALWVARADGTERTLLADGFSFIQQVSWSADGQRLVWVGVHDTEDMQTRDTYVVQRTGGEPLLLSDLVDLLEPRWAADGRGIVGVDLSQTGRPLLYSFAADGSSGGALAHVVNRPGTTTPTIDVEPTEFVGTQRIRGANRIRTSQQISYRGFERADAVVVARADAYPDALAGAALAASVGGPLLLTDGRQLSQPILWEVERLFARTAYVLGGPAAISDRVVQSLRSVGVMEPGDAGVDVVRIGGADRYETAALVAARVGGNEAILVRGADGHSQAGWPDAASASGVSAAAQIPILLTDGEGLSPATRQALQGRQAVTIVGGPAAVSPSVEDALRAAGHDVSRVAGSDRYATSVAVADWAATRGITSERIIAVTGMNWPDALSAGPLTAEVGGQLLMVPPTGIPIPSPTASWIRQHAPTEMFLIGGSQALHPQVALGYHALIGN